MPKVNMHIPVSRIAISQDPPLLLCRCGSAHPVDWRDWYDTDERNTETNLAGELKTLCIVPNCTDYAVAEVMHRLNIHWPSGRALKGCIEYTNRVCERHFEHLVEGKVIHA